jgi:hypothetical protein
MSVIYGSKKLYVRIGNAEQEATWVSKNKNFPRIALAKQNVQRKIRTLPAVIAKTLYKVLAILKVFCS